MLNINKLIRRCLLFKFILIGLILCVPASAFASEPFIGEIRIFAGNFAPRGWAFCDGQLLQISQNTALFSIIGTIYGGDGRTTLGLPDLRGRTPLHPGTGPGLTTRRLGYPGGNKEHFLSSTQLPNHTHPVSVSATSNVGDSASPTDKTWAKTSDGSNDYASAPDDINTMDSSFVEIEATGSASAHNNRPPYLGVQYIIALTGLYPSRN